MPNKNESKTNISILSQAAIMESVANQLIGSFVPYLDSLVRIPFALFAHE